MYVEFQSLVPSTYRDESQWKGMKKVKFGIHLAHTIINCFCRYSFL